MNIPRKSLIRLGILVLLALAAYGVWWALRPAGLPDGFASANGRVEAVEIDIAAKTAGRVAELLVDEGDFVEPGQELARMDTLVLEAQLREAEANLKEAKIGIDTAKSQVKQAEANHRAAEAVVAQRQAELDVAQKTFERVQQLVQRETSPIQRLDDQTAVLEGAKAVLNAAEAQLAAAEANVSAANAGVISAEARVGAVEAAIERIKADIADSTLTSPRVGRVQYVVARPGEVVSAGGVLLNIMDLRDVYITFFLPTSAAGRISIGNETRIVLDAAPEYVIPASISYVADVAQFTPRTVETQEEREKLMFRIKARVDPSLLERYVSYVKTGLPGVAYVQVDKDAPWPENLTVRLPE
ncbi:HlyD family secretion protein [Acuticoccus kandeliae]|uniref:HlyD family secretion protein n=1 Tax=Acuticoccus kandeliae TaxID=2073160 RepID=UPI000D3E62C5|nr:HlyD family efflux transporter periplasmic adaptor subunit [Acuticoccus kandeliae]